MVVAQKFDEWQEASEQKSVVENSRSVRRRKRFSKLKSIMVLVAVVGLAGGIGAKTIHLTVVQGAEIRALENEIAEIKMRNDLLQMEADKLRSVGRIESEALAMGMEKPTGKVYMAGVITPGNNQEGDSSTQAETQTKTQEKAETEPSALQQFSKKFTGFFASIQR